MVALLVGLASDNDNGSMALYDGGSQRVRISAGTQTNFIQDGIFGIGTNLPTSELDVRGGAFGNNQEIGVQLGTPGGQWLSRMFLRSNASGVPRLTLDVPSDGSGSTLEALSITNLGKVGLGTETPSEKLHVANGSVLADTKVMVGDFGAPSSSTAGVNLYAGGAIYVRRNNDNPIFRGYDDSGSTVNSQIDNKGNAFFLGDFGIGTNTPTANLDIKGVSGANPGDNHYLQISGSGSLFGLRSSDSSNQLTLDRKWSGVWEDAISIKRSNGHVGIGVATPTAILEIKGNSTLQDIKIGDGTTTGYFMTSYRANRPLANTAIHIHDFRWGKLQLQELKRLLALMLLTKATDI